MCVPILRHSVDPIAVFFCMLGLLLRYTVYHQRMNIRLSLFLTNFFTTTYMGISRNEGGGEIKRLWFLLFYFYFLFNQILFHGISTL